MDTQPKKCRLCRSAGQKLFLKGARCLSPHCPIERRGALPPRPISIRRKRRLSDYGQQLKETQQLKRTYGIREGQLKRYFRVARKEKEATSEALLQALEGRLDNVVYRLGFAPSRKMSRQLVNHGHVLVNGKTVDIPSYQTELGDVIGLGSKALKVEEVKKILTDKDYNLPGWLERKAGVGKIARLPERGDIDTNVNEQLIVGYCSRY